MKGGEEKKMLDHLFQKHLDDQIRKAIKGKLPDEAKAIIAGEIYIKKHHLAQARQQEELLNDEIAELQKFDVEKEIKNAE